MRIILGSGSPRRRELLAGLDVDFTVDSGNNFEETMDTDVPACRIPVLMSQGKSHGFHRALDEDELLITSDTVVIADGSVPMGKPHSREDAFAMLRKLSGSTHEVITAVTLRSLGREETVTDTTKVTFSPLSDSQIYYYLDKYRPYDKAGAYGIQEWIGYIGIEKIEGSFYNVMGFPTHRVFEMLRKFGYENNCSVF